MKGIPVSPKHAFSFLFLLLLLPSAAGASTNVRGWYAQGQTWIVWEETDPIPFTYDIYRAPSPFSEIGQAELAGRLFPEEWEGARIKLGGQELEFTIPAAGGGTYTLAANEGVFAYTPHAVATDYFAVIKHGETAVSPEMSTGAVIQTYNPLADPVTAHVQLAGQMHSGYLVTIYALWIDGRDDGAARPDIPVMGNSRRNGTPHVFSVAEPPGGAGAGPIPCVVLLHGGNGNYLNWVPGTKPQIGIDPVEGITVQHDDVLYRLVEDELTQEPTVYCSSTWWFGYYEDYDPFELPPLRPPLDGVVADYTMKRLDWVNEWLIDEWDVDPQRISIMGHSMGGTGAGVSGRRHPDRYGSVTCFNPILHVPMGIYVRQILGSENDNLPTSLTSLGGAAVHTQDIFHPDRLFSPDTDDLPFTRNYLGRDDTNVNAQWDSVMVAHLRTVDSAGCGTHIYWDGRPHAVPEWDGHWSNTESQTARDDVAAQNRYRADLSYPGICNDDQNSAQPGRQPDPGNGDPGDGDPFGTWGGYFDWETDTITDTSGEWGCTIFLTGLSPNGVDNCPVESVTADVVIRKAQLYRPEAGTAVNWELKRVSDGALLQQGSVEVGEDGRIRIASLEFFKDPVRCRLSAATAGGDTTPPAPPQGVETSVIPLP